jgi:hypothetical protein
VCPNVQLPSAVSAPLTIPHPADFIHPRTLFIDQFDPIPNRFIDVGAGGPAPFTFTTAINATWLTVSTSHGSISPNNTEIRVFANVDWSKAEEGLNFGAINFTAVSGKPETTLLVPVFIVANKTNVPSTFKGMEIPARWTRVLISMQVSSRAEERSPSKLSTPHETTLWQTWSGESCPVWAERYLA